MVKTKQIIRCAMICGLLLCGWPAVQGAMPQLIDIQGRLVDDTGELVNGTTNITVAVYDAQTDGSLLYTESLSSVPIQNGVYSFTFGDTNLAAALTNDASWVELTVGSETLDPRYRLIAVPYALRAARAEQVENEVDPLFTNWLDTNTYVQSETDPVWASEKANYATGTPVYAESDPIWVAERSNYATGTPLYAYSESDPFWATEKSNYATGTPVYAETDPVWTASSNLYYLKAQSDARYLQPANNLGDLSDVASARSNLQLGTMATQATDQVQISGGNLNNVVVSNVDLVLSSGSSLDVEQAMDFEIFGSLGSNILQIGSAGSQVLFPGNIEVLGTQTVHEIETLTLSTNQIILNRDGDESTALAAGILIEQNGETLGYFRVSPGDNRFLQFRAPGGSNVLIVATNTDMTLTLNESVNLPADFVAAATYQSATNNIWSQLSQAATGTPLYAYTEIDPVWATEKGSYATGTPVYTESDPVWGGASNLYYLKTESDALYATGMPLYAFAESDPAFTNWLATNNAVVAETDPIFTNWLADSYRATVDADVFFYHEAAVDANNAIVVADFGDYASVPPRMAFGAYSSATAAPQSMYRGGVLIIPADMTALTNIQIMVYGTTISSSTNKIDLTLYDPDSTASASWTSLTTTSPAGWTVKNLPAAGTFLTNNLAGKAVRIRYRPYAWQNTTTAVERVWRLMQ